MPKISSVLVTYHDEFELLDDFKPVLERAVPEACITYCSRDDLIPELIANTQVWIGNPSLRQISQAAALRFVQLNSAGADYYFKEPGSVPPHVLIACSSGAFGLSISEYMVGGLLMLMRRMHIYRDQQHSSLWRRAGKAHTIHGSSVLVVGVGNLGSEFAMRIKSLGARVTGVRRSGSAHQGCFDEVFNIDELDSLLPNADVVALCVPGTTRTAGLMGSERLKLMKHGSYLINVGRGSAVDAYALCRELQSGRVAGALIDVTDPEPLPSEHPLWREENALITPHVSGIYDVRHSLDRIIEIAAENLIRFDSDQPLINLVDPITGYSSK